MAKVKYHIPGIERRKSKKDEYKKMITIASIMRGDNDDKHTTNEKPGRSLHDNNDNLFVRKELA